MDASQYEDYVLVLLFVKYVSDRSAPTLSRLQSYRWVTRFSRRARMKRRQCQAPRGASPMPFETPMLQRTARPLVPAVRDAAAETRTAKVKLATRGLRALQGYPLRGIAVSVGTSISLRIGCRLRVSAGVGG